jgi:hypothetical protein
LIWSEKDKKISILKEYSYARDMLSGIASKASLILTHIQIGTEHHYQFITAGKIAYKFVYFSRDFLGPEPLSMLLRRKRQVLLSKIQP